MRVRRAVVAACALSLAGAACGTLLDLQAPPDERSDAGGASDATMPGTDTGPPVDGPAPESSSDGATADGGPPMCPPLNAPLPVGATDAAQTVFNTMNDVVDDDAGNFSWQFVNLSSVNVAATNYAGGTFDGRYVYFVPANSALVTRYDTTALFGKVGFSTFDLTTLGIPAALFEGAVFDGRYVYFVPHSGTGPSNPGLVVRFDTTGTFGPGPSWSAFDTATIPVSNGGTPARGFSGGVFDGRYVYFVPHYNNMTVEGRVARYDTLEPDAGSPVEAGASDAGDAGDAGAAGLPQFGSAAQWSTFDTTTNFASALGFRGGVFDGRYVYLVPFHNGGGENNGNSGVVSRFDTTGTFISNSSWSSYDLTGISAQGNNFLGGAFDGRYLYLVPNSQSLVFSFDTQREAGLGSRVSWAPFDLSTIVHLPEGGATDFAGGAFDGRFVYLIPANSGQLVRYDTMGGCWSVFDVSQLNPAANSFFGAVYDGKHLYLMPTGTWAARFNTKSPKWMPNLPAFHGSFF